MTRGGAAAEATGSLIYRSRLVRAALRGVAATGHDVGPLMKTYGLSPRALQDPETGIALALCRRLMAECAEYLGVPSLGLHLATTLPRGYLGAFDASTGSAPTLREAAQRFVKYLPLFTPMFRAEIVESGRSVTLRQWIDGEPTAQGDHANDFVPAAMVRHVRELIGDTRAVEEVLFAHPRPYSVARLTDYFGDAKLRFGAGVNGMVIRRELLDRAQISADPLLMQEVDRCAAALLGGAQDGDDGLVLEVRRAIRANLTHADSLLPRVADVLRTGTRTLQRRLRDRHTSFRSLVEQVRREAMSELRSRGHHRAGQLAGMLGYAERSSFSRAARRWRSGLPR